VLPHFNPPGRWGSESFARLALTRVPLVAPLGLEPGILGEKPQALEGPGRFECSSRSAIRRAHDNASAGTSSVVERHRSGPRICGVEGAEDGGSRQDSGDYSAMTTHWLAESRFLPICDFYFTGIAGIKVELWNCQDPGDHEAMNSQSLAES
jgi:hypothetical protein